MKKRRRKERKQEHFKSFVKKISSRWTSKAVFLKKFERLPLGWENEKSLHRTGCSQWFYDPSDLKRHMLGCKCCSDFADPELVVTWRPPEYILRFDICFAFPPPSPKDHYETMHRIYQNAKVCGKLLNQVVRVCWGLHLAKIWKLLALLLREINTLFESVFGVSLCNGLVTAILPWQRISWTARGREKKIKPRREKHAWVLFYVAFLFILPF